MQKYGKSPQVKNGKEKTDAKIWEESSVLLFRFFRSTVFGPKTLHATSFEARMTAIKMPNQISQRKRKK